MRVTPELESALARVDDVFEKKLGKLPELCGHDRADARESPTYEAFEAVVREHRARRLELPVRMILEVQAGHGSALVHGSARRFAWFVPALFAEALREGFAEMLEIVASLAAEARAGELREDFTADEKSAATVFLTEALRPVLADFDAYEAATIFAAAAGLGLDPKPLVDAWLALPDAETTIARVLAAEWITEDGEPQSLEEQIGRLVLRRRSALGSDHHVDPQRALVRALATEDVRAWFEAKCLAETDPEKQELLSAVEQRISAERRRS